MTQADVAKRINRSRQAYSFYEQGTFEPDSETLAKLAELFQIDIAELLGITRPSDGITNDNTITVYGRGMGMKKYKVSRKRLAAIQALLEDDDETDDLDF